MRRRYGSSLLEQREPIIDATYNFIAKPRAIKGKLDALSPILQPYY